MMEGGSALIARGDEKEVEVLLQISGISIGGNFLESQNCGRGKLAQRSERIQEW